VEPPDAPGIAEERRTTPVELLWDLVFVFAVTQVTTLLSQDLSWAGFGRSMLVLALVWWAWSAFVWAANAQDTESQAMRAILLSGMLLIFITGLALPQAFGADATLFAATYAGVRFLHLGLYADASRRGNASWAAIAGFAITVTLGMALLIAGSFLDGTQRVAHFAERYSLFIIICLGESIVAIGVGASGLPLDGELVAAVALGLLITMALWWTYFDRFAATAEERLRSHDDPVLAAADAYSYLHLVLVAGIIVFAVGVKLAVHDVGDPLSDAARLALCGGVALYLVGHVAFAWRMGGGVSYTRLWVVVALLVLYLAGGGLPAWAVAGMMSAILAALCALEAVRDHRGALVGAS
jgi:low temperature requirement protein LtrA